MCLMTAGQTECIDFPNWSYILMIFLVFSLIYISFYIDFKTIFKKIKNFFIRNSPIIILLSIFAFWNIFLFKLTEKYVFSIDCGLSKIEGVVYLTSCNYMPYFATLLVVSCILTIGVLSGINFLINEAKK